MFKRFASALLACVLLISAAASTVSADFSDPLPLPAEEIVPEFATAEPPAPIETQPLPDISFNQFSEPLPDQSDFLEPITDDGILPGAEMNATIPEHSGTFTLKVNLDFGKLSDYVKEGSSLFVKVPAYWGDAFIGGTIQVRMELPIATSSGSTTYTGFTLGTARAYDSSYIGRSYSFKANFGTMLPIKNEYCTYDSFRLIFEVYYIDLAVVDYRKLNSVWEDFFLGQWSSGVSGAENAFVAILDNSTNSYAANYGYYPINWKYEDRSVTCFNKNHEYVGDYCKYCGSPSPLDMANIIGKPLDEAKAEFEKKFGACYVTERSSLTSSTDKTYYITDDPNLAQNGGFSSTGTAFTITVNTDNIITVVMPSMISYSVGLRYNGESFSKTKAELDAMVQNDPKNATSTKTPAYYYQSGAMTTIDGHYMYSYAKLEEDQNGNPIVSEWRNMNDYMSYNPTTGQVVEYPNTSNWETGYYWTPTLYYYPISDIKEKFAKVDLNILGLKPSEAVEKIEEALPGASLPNYMGEVDIDHLSLVQIMYSGNTLIQIYNASQSGVWLVDGFSISPLRSNSMSMASVMGAPEGVTTGSCFETLQSYFDGISFGKVEGFEGYMSEQELIAAGAKRIDGSYPYDGAIGRIYVLTNDHAAAAYIVSNFTQDSQGNVTINDKFTSHLYNVFRLGNDWSKVVLSDYIGLSREEVRRRIMLDLGFGSNDEGSAISAVDDDLRLRVYFGSEDVSVSANIERISGNNMSVTARLTYGINVPQAAKELPYLYGSYGTGAEVKKLMSSGAVYDVEEVTGEEALKKSFGSNIDNFKDDPELPNAICYRYIFYSGNAKVIYEGCNFKAAYTYGVDEKPYLVILDDIEDYNFTTSVEAYTPGVDDRIEVECEGGSIYIDKHTGQVVAADETVTNVEIPAKFGTLAVTSIAADAFAGCSSLTELTIPSSVKTIEKNAFAECESLETINFGASETAWNAAGGDKSGYPAQTTVNFVKYTPGDVNDDGNVSLADAILTLQKSLDLNITDTFIEEAADLNGDESVTLADAIIILQISLDIYVA